MSIKQIYLDVKSRTVLMRDIKCILLKWNYRLESINVCSWKVLDQIFPKMSQIIDIKPMADHEQPENDYNT